MARAWGEAGMAVTLIHARHRWNTHAPDIGLRRTRLRGLGSPTQPRSTSGFRTARRQLAGAMTALAGAPRAVELDGPGPSYVSQSGSEAAIIDARHGGGVLEGHTRPD